MRPGFLRVVDASPILPILFFFSESLLLYSDE
eukprot:COSAG06_NODE_757_length_12510_cov_69.462529_16_plen_32_part_00